MASTKFTASQGTVTNDTVLAFLKNQGIDITSTFIETKISPDNTKLLGLTVGTTLTQQQKNAITAQYPDLIPS